MCVGGDEVHDAVLDESAGTLAHAPATLAQQTSRTHLDQCPLTDKVQELLGTLPYPGVAPGVRNNRHHPQNQQTKHHLRHLVRDAVSRHFEHQVVSLSAERQTRVTTDQFHQILVQVNVGPRQKLDIDAGFVRRPSQRGQTHLCCLVRTVIHPVETVRRRDDGGDAVTCRHLQHLERYVR
ncbi:MAG: hypothetical protein AMK75_04910 [Planctomycetes bacterium SM23_65]|nr:MAG: hypothetical protein AMK75_04910 [Planctomycetes bacterium SM23_65]